MKIKWTFGNFMLGIMICLFSIFIANWIYSGYRYMYPAPPVDYMTDQVCDNFINWRNLTFKNNSTIYELCHNHYDNQNLTPERHVEKLMRLIFPFYDYPHHMPPNWQPLKELQCPADDNNCT